MTRSALIIRSLLVIGFACASSAMGEEGEKSINSPDPQATLPLPKAPVEVPVATPEKSSRENQGSGPRVGLKEGPQEYEELTTKDGTVYRKCKVVRVEPDGLVVEHGAGVAKLSFFDLPETVQSDWGFDPFKAMDHYKASVEQQRDLRWRLFWERQQYESQKAREDDQERLRATAIREWVPVEARIIRPLSDGKVLARCQRVTFEKTKTKSTLGFIIDGPPKRVLVPFSKDPIILRMVISGEVLPGAGGTWKGYVHPRSEDKSAFRIRGEGGQAKIHAAAPAKR